MPCSHFACIWTALIILDCQSSGLSVSEVAVKFCRFWNNSCLDCGSYSISVYTSKLEACPIGVCAHSSRSMASSWAWNKGMLFQDNCLSGWSSLKTFGTFYNLKQGCQDCATKPTQFLIKTSPMTAKTSPITFQCNPPVKITFQGGKNCISGGGGLLLQPADYKN